MEARERLEKAENDLVVTFLKDVLESTGDSKDYVQRARLYQLFREYVQKTALVEEKGKMCIGKMKFLQRLKTVLGDRIFKERHCGSREVFLGWKFKSLSGL
eukprot:55187-Eustigmatos_ZCMA.PRE.1